jgi:glucokinase
MLKAVIGIDLGGTRIKAVALDHNGNVLHQLYTPTKDGNDTAWKQSVITAVDELQTKLESPDFVIGISAPGIPNEKNSCINYMPGRLQGLENFDWSSFLKQKTFVLNDAVAALMAEAKLGVAKDKKNAVLLTLGTGVGGAILIDGQPYQGNFQKAGHIGHIVIDHEDGCDVTGMPGSLEDAIGNVTVQKRSLGKFHDTHALLEAYRTGDHFAKWVWLSSVRKLAIGIASVINTLSPECVILGGGITEAGDDLFEPLENFLSLYEWRPGGNKAFILKAQFGDMAGAIGAACFAMMPLSPAGE